MDITDFAKGSMWAMPAERFDVLFRQFNEIKAADVDAFMLNFKEEEKSAGYENIAGVAVIPVSGTITKNSSVYSWFFGGTSVADLTEIMQAAITDPEVKSILLNIDSPGGSVNGLDALSEAIYEARGQKPIVAYANGMMASAAYWIGSAAESVVSDKTADIGSIGVLMIHTDFSEYDKKVGIKTTYLTAGKYKALGNDAEPLSDLARETFQKELDYIYGIFVDAVARNRGVSAEEVQDKMADGRIFIGQQAVDAGLADYVGTIDDAHQLALSLVNNNNKKQTGGMPSGKEQVTMFGKEKVVMPSTSAELIAQLPELAKELMDQGAKSVDVKGLTEAAAKEAVGAEVGRILGLVSAQFGDEAGAAFKLAIESGMTGDQLKAYNALNPKKVEPSAEDKLKAEMLAALQKSGAQNPGAGDTESGVTLSVEEQAKKDFATKQDIRDAFGVEARYVAFKLAEAAGRIRVLKNRKEG
jgi:signal peptide peptidase SppA